MTTPEHSLVGIHLALAFGIHQRFGWTAVAIAGLASNIPDWDGLPMLINMAKFEAGHRVWGHNFVAIIISSVILAWSQSRYRWLEYLHLKLSPFLPTSNATSPRSLAPSMAALFVFSFIAQSIHLPCDMVVSGGNSLMDWYVKPFWPFADTGYVFPLIPWGDVGPTLILMCGAISIAKYPNRTRSIAIGSIVCLCLYLLLRGWMRNAF